MSSILPKGLLDFSSLPQDSRKLLQFRPSLCIAQGCRPYACCTPDPCLPLCMSDFWVACAAIRLAWWAVCFGLPGLLPAFSACSRLRPAPTGCQLSCCKLGCKSGGTSQSPPPNDATTASHCDSIGVELCWATIIWRTRAIPSSSLFIGGPTFLDPILQTSSFNGGKCLSGFFITA